MLLRVTRQCSYGVVCNVCFAVGLCVSKMGGVSVIQGIVIMGESSITLCSSSRVCADGPQSPFVCVCV